MCIATACAFTVQLSKNSEALDIMPLTQYHDIENVMIDS